MNGLVAQGKMFKQWWYGHTHHGVVASIQEPNKLVHGIGKSQGGVELQACKKAAGVEAKEKAVWSGTPSMYLGLEWHTTCDQGLKCKEHVYANT